MHSYLDLSLDFNIKVVSSVPLQTLGNYDSAQSQQHNYHIIGNELLDNREVFIKS